MFDVAHSVNGVHTVYQGCCLTHKKVKVWKPKEMRICVITDISKGAEMRPDGGRQETKSFHAAFRLTANRHNRVKRTKINTKEPEGGKKLPQLRSHLLVNTITRMMAISMKRN